jgi:heme exporter protein A
MPEAPPVPLFKACDLRCERDERVLFEGLSFTLAPGEIVQILGPNGAGKTTLLRAVAGLSTRVSGEMYWNGAALPGSRWEFLRETLYLGHDAAVKPGLTPIENLRWHAGLWGRTTSTGIEGALGAVGLARHRDTPAQHLSAGQRRRIALARLLLSPARFWILDEPFTAIDLEGVSQVESLVAAHAAAGGVVLLTTHHRLSLDCRFRQVALESGALA